ncbi:MAG: pyrroline-5-carboxylate reductase [Candidatus Aureabacteria bacterium]|nr:pyrroline-5-carboxylate reductase [Candidatus Auribacterota bacterium]
MAQRLEGKLGFIGGGNMAEAFMRAILDAGLCLGSDIMVSDPRRERLEHLRNACGVQIAGSNRECVEGSDLVVVAVKPQTMGVVLRELAAFDLRSKSIISIVTGVTTGRIEQALGGEVPVIRVMPNTPALVGEGVSVWSTGAHAGATDIKRATEILGAMGKEFRVSEDLLNAATAISGSGPAYVFYLIEGMAAGGVKLGFTPEQALQIAIHTVIGAGKLAALSGQPPEELRRKVTSPGGTTAAAVKVLDDRRVKKVLVDAIEAACARAKELSEGKE